MKRRKIKLFASVASFALVAAVMSFGVFAALSQNIQVTSSVNFSATGVKGTVVSATVTSLDQAAVVETAYGDDKSFDASTAANALNWATGDITINTDELLGSADGGKYDLVYTFIIENTGETAIKAVATQTTTPANMTAGAITYSISATETGEYEVAVDAKTTAEKKFLKIEVAYDVTNASTGIPGEDLELNIVLSAQ